MTKRADREKGRKKEDREGEREGQTEEGRRGKEKNHVIS